MCACLVGDRVHLEEGCVQVTVLEFEAAVCVTNDGQAHGWRRWTTERRRSEPRSGLRREPMSGLRYPLEPTIAPMYVLPISSLLEYDQLPGYEQLRADDRLELHDEHKPTAFISHTWLGSAHPDPGIWIRKAKGACSLPTADAKVCVTPRSGKQGVARKGAS